MRNLRPINRVLILAARKILLHPSELISFSESADSFFEKKPEEHRSPKIGGWRFPETFDPCSLASAPGLAQTQFPHQRPDSFAFCQAFRRPRSTAVSKNPERRNLHHLDW